MMSSALFAEPESEPELCLCGHPESAHRGTCVAGDLPTRHLVAEARKAAARRGLCPIMLVLAVLDAVGSPCSCRRFEKRSF